MSSFLYNILFIILKRFPDKIKLLKVCKVISLTHKIYLQKYIGLPSIYLKIMFTIMIRLQLFHVFTIFLTNNQLSIRTNMDRKVRKRPVACNDLAQCVFVCVSSNDHVDRIVCRMFGTGMDVVPCGFVCVL